MNRVVDNIDQKSREWIDAMIYPVIGKFDNVYLKILGTGALTDETIMIE